MTAPVEMSLDQRDGMMGFMYESTRQGELGTDRDVEVVDIAPHSVLSMTIRGYRTDAGVAMAQGADRVIGHRTARTHHQR